MILTNRINVLINLLATSVARIKEPNSNLDEIIYINFNKTKENIINYLIDYVKIINKDDIKGVTFCNKIVILDNFYNNFDLLKIICSNLLKNSELIIIIDSNIDNYQLKNMFINHDIVKIVETNNDKIIDKYIRYPL